MKYPSTVTKAFPIPIDGIVHREKEIILCVYCGGTGIVKGLLPPHKCYCRGKNIMVQETIIRLATDNDVKII